MNDFRKIIAKIPLIPKIYGIIALVWHFLVLIESSIGAGKIIGALLMLFFWIFITPLKLLMQSLSISAPAFLSFETMGMWLWVIIHLLNFFILLLLSFIFIPITKRLRKEISDNRIA